MDRTPDTSHSYRISRLERRLRRPAGRRQRPLQLRFSPPPSLRGGEISIVLSGEFRIDRDTARASDSAAYSGEFFGAYRTKTQAMPRRTCSAFASTPSHSTRPSVRHSVRDVLRGLADTNPRREGGSNATYAPYFPASLTASASILSRKCRYRFTKSDSPMSQRSGARGVD